MKKREVKRTLSADYSAQKARSFWTRRVRSAGPLAAVLTYGAHPDLNRAYDEWERGVLKRALPSSLRHKKALDLGCGIGRIAVLLAQAGAVVTAVDVSPKMLTRCRERARRKRVASRVTTVEASVHDIPDFGHKFDIVTCFGLLEHLPDRERTACLQRALDVLKSRGNIYVIVNNSDSPFLVGKYGMQRQRNDGYFVTLVGMTWLEKFCRKRSMSLSFVAANPFYALIHYGLAPRLREAELDHKTLGALCKLAVELDLDEPGHRPEFRKSASHFMVRIKRSR